MKDPNLVLALYEPDIAANAGAMLRTCAATFAGRLTLWRTFLAASFMTSLCTEMMRGVH